MKPVVNKIMVLIPICCFLSLLAFSRQNETLSDTTILQDAKILSANDSVAFKRFCDSILYSNRNPFSDRYIENKINNKLFENLKYTPLPKQQVYFTIHDFTRGYHMARVSQYENPFFDNVRQLRFLWSGHVKPYIEIGASQNYLRSLQQPPLIIKVIRGSKGIKGIWIERLQPEFHYIP